MSTCYQCDQCETLGTVDEEVGRVLGWFRVVDYDPDTEVDADGWADWPEADLCSTACLRAWAQDDDEDEEDDHDAPPARQARRRR